MVVYSRNEGGLKIEITNSILDFLNGKWVETQIVCSLLNISFSEGMEIFEFSRTAEWWSICEVTEEERNRDGQKIITQFRLRQTPIV